MLNIEQLMSINLTAAMFDAIIPNQYGLCIGEASEIAFLFINKNTPINTLQTTPPILTIV